VSFNFSIGLGTLLSGSRIVSDGMLQAAAERYVLEDSVISGNTAIVN
jgi:malate dehydrogenase (decarboxylating)